jgi:hypothetical protein
MSVRIAAEVLAMFDQITEFTEYNERCRTINLSLLRPPSSTGSSYPACRHAPEKSEIELALFSKNQASS